MNLGLGTSWSAVGLGLGVDLAIKATALLVLILLIQNTLRSRRASIGAAVGNAGLLGLLLLPFAVLGLPTMPVACFPTEAIAPVAESTIPIPENREPMSVPEETIVRSSVENPPPIDFSIVETSHQMIPIPAEPMDVVEVATSSPVRNIDCAGVAIVGYAAVALCFLLRLGISFAAVARLRHSCEKVDDPYWGEALKRGRRTLGIGRAVMLAWSPRVCVPVVLGFFRPTIVLPASLTDPDARKHADAVLLHELSHVRRNDYPWNLLLRIVQAIYWPHILVWVLGRLIKEDRERACDDLCIHELGGPSAYRDTLLAVASRMVAHHSLVLGMAMARSSKLGRRLEQIDASTGDDRCLPGRLTRVAIASMAIMLASVIGAIQFVRVQASPIPQEQAPAVEKPGRVFHLKVVAADAGEPVPEAEVRVWIAFHDFYRKTDAQGRLDIEFATGPADQTVGVDVWGKGLAMQRYNWGRDPNKPIPDGETIKLQPGETLGGRVQDEEGRPIAGATVYLWSHNYKRKDPHELLYDLRATTGPDGQWQTSGAPETTGELLGFHVEHPDFLSLRGYGDPENIPRIAELRTGKAVTVAKRGIPIEGRVVDAKGSPVVGARVASSQYQTHVMEDRSPATTDAKGRFRTRQVKIDSGEWFVGTLAKGHAPDVRTLKITKESPWLEIDLGVPRTFKGRVVDPDGKPVAGAFIDVDGWQSIRGLNVYLYSDAEGHFHWDDAPNDALTVNVNNPGYFGVFQQKVAPSVEEEVFTLKPSLRIDGRVRDAETKKRIDNATVQYSIVDPKTGEATKWTAMHELGFSTGVYQGAMSVNFPVAADTYKIRVESPGYKTFVSRTFRRDEKVIVDYDINLEPGADKLTGNVATVLRPDGKPLAGARVLEIQENGSVPVSDGVPNVAQGRGVREGRTDPAGKFSIPQYDKPWFVFILGADSYALASKEDLDNSHEIKAKPYAQVRGRYLIGTRPVPNQGVELLGGISDPSMFGSIHLDQKTKTDAQGRFMFKNVVPDTGLRVSRQDRSGAHWSLGESVRAKPGQTVDIMLGGKGRPVIGRIERPEGSAQPIDFTVESEAGIETNYSWMPYPLSLFRGKTSLGAEWNDWLHRWPGSPEGREHGNRRVAIHVGVAPDGSFRIDDVPPGEYRLGITVNGKVRFHATVMRGDPGPFGRIVKTFTVPPIPGGRSDEPLDLGVMRLQPRVEFKVGEPAPGFEVTTVDGKKLAVPGDFRGKYLLLDFSTLWDTQSGIQITRLNDVFQKYGNDPRFTILSLTLAADEPETHKHIMEKGEPWPQAIIGTLSNPTSLAYHLDDETVPAAILIGPDGNIIAGALYSNKIVKGVGEALGPAEK